MFSCIAGYKIYGAEAGRREPHEAILKAIHQNSQVYFRITLSQCGEPGSSVGIATELPF